jgi:uncharacterized protein (DUF3820 family)
MSLERAGAIEMPFGKFEGKPLAVLARTIRGRAYLDWLKDRDWLSPRLRRAIRVILAGGRDHS